MCILQVINCHYYGGQDFGCVHAGGAAEVMLLVSPALFGDLRLYYFKMSATGLADLPYYVDPYLYDATTRPWCAPCSQTWSLSSKRLLMLIDSVLQVCVRVRGFFGWLWAAVPCCGDLGLPVCHHLFAARVLIQCRHRR